MVREKETHESKKEDRKDIHLPSYLALYESGELHQRAAALWDRLQSCTICPRRCNKNRIAGKVGVCRTGAELLVSSYGPHFGEESPLVGINGSGTIFFTNCNLWCLFCQNYEISHLRHGNPISTNHLATIMLHLQEIGCHNINLVTPTHVIPHIVKGLIPAIEKGLHIPLVYNTSGYDSVETLKMLDGAVDIYMPDIKYSDNNNSKRYSGVKDYWTYVQPAIVEMHRQVGDLRTDEDGIARHGLLIRHLVLPNHVSGSEKVLEFIAKEISLTSYVNIMNQYRPAFKALTLPGINRSISSEEFGEVLTYARRCGLTRGFEETS